MSITDHKRLLGRTYDEGATIRDFTFNFLNVPDRQMQTKNPDTKFVYALGGETAKPTITIQVYYAYCLTKVDGRSTWDKPLYDGEAYQYTCNATFVDLLYHAPAKRKFHSAQEHYGYYDYDTDIDRLADRIIDYLETMYGLYKPIVEQLWF